MADPISIIGLAASMLGVSDIIARSIKGLLGIQASYKAAHLMVTIIIGHLTTVKAALNEIIDWASSTPSSSGHTQLVLDIRNAVRSCEVIVVALDERIESLTQGSDDLNFKAKLGYALEEESIKTFSDHLSNQVHALHLLITAANCRTTDEQILLLQDRETRQVFRQIEDDSSSYRRPDSSRIGPLLTGRSIACSNLTDLDIDFEFDSQVINSDVYRRALRAVVKSSKHQSIADDPQNSEDVRQTNLEAIGEEHSDTASMVSTIHAPHESDDHKLEDKRDGPFKWAAQRFPMLGPRPRRKTGSHHTGTTAPSKELQSKEKDVNLYQSQARRNIARSFVSLISRRSRKEEEGRRRNIEIEMQLNEDRTGKNLEMNTLVLGTGQSGKSTFGKCLKIYAEGEYITEEKATWKELVFDNLVSATKLVLNSMERREEMVGPKLKSAVDDIHSMPYHPETINTIRSFLDNPHVQSFLSREPISYYDNAEYFWEEMERIGSSTYIPSTQDILRLYTKTTGITETAYNVEGFMPIRLFDVGGYRPERNKWIHCFEKGAATIIFTADIAEFDQTLTEDETYNRLQETITLFDVIVNSWFVHTELVLLFTKVDKLKKKILISDLKAYIPEIQKDSPSIGDVKAYLAYKLCTLRSKRMAVVFSSFFEGRNPAAMVIEAVVKLFVGPIASKLYPPKPKPGEKLVPSHTTREVIVIDGTEPSHSPESLSSWQDIETRFISVTTSPPSVVDHHRW